MDYLFKLGKDFFLDIVAKTLLKRYNVSLEGFGLMDEPLYSDLLHFFCFSSKRQKSGHFMDSLCIPLNN